MGAVIRDGQASIARGGTVLKAGDDGFIIALPDAGQVDKFFRSHAYFRSKSDI